MQIHADTAGLPVRTTGSKDAPSLGAAILAAHGAGHFDSIDAGIAAMVKSVEVYRPNPRMAQYAAIYENYKALYPALKKPYNHVICKSTYAKNI